MYINKFRNLVGLSLLAIVVLLPLVLFYFVIKQFTDSVVKQEIKELNILMDLRKIGDKQTVQYIDSLNRINLKDKYKTKELLDENIFNYTSTKNLINQYIIIIEDQ